MDNNRMEITNDWIQEIVENLEEQIVRTITLMGKNAHLSFSLAPYSLGYIFGFFSGGIEFHHIHRDLEKVKLFTRAYTKLFGEAGQEILQLTLTTHNEDNVLFMEGKASGREECFRWYHRRENPIGLLRYVLYGEKTKSLISKVPSTRWLRPAVPIAG